MDLKPSIFFHNYCYGHKQCCNKLDFYIFKYAISQLLKIGSSNFLYTSHNNPMIMGGGHKNYDDLIWKIWDIAKMKIWKFFATPFTLKVGQSLIFSPNSMKGQMSESHIAQTGPHTVWGKVRQKFIHITKTFLKTVSLPCWLNTPFVCLFCQHLWS